MSSVNRSPATEEQVCWTEEQGLWLNIVVKEEEKEVTVNTGERHVVTVRDEEGPVGVKEEDNVPVKEEGWPSSLKEEHGVTVKGEEINHYAIFREEDELSGTSKRGADDDEEGKFRVVINTRERCVHPGSSEESQQDQDPDKVEKRVSISGHQMDNSIPALSAFPDVSGLKKVSVRLVDFRKTLRVIRTIRRGDSTGQSNTFCPLM
ncbi:hypothetical protein UPYG_G00057560 [Umbra pygmaea]|uniref:Uncharacterized protein n=1 Tax=Umbra pygmaea TaxID=75934 RepID=A0ABD0XVZ0_UMBPY